MRDMKDSGVEWLGKIPKDWSITRIKNLFELRNERNYDALEDVNLISLYTDKGVVQHSDLTETTGNKAVTADGYKIVKENDIVVNIILCWMGAVGRSAYNGVTSPAYDVYKPLSDTNSKYYHYLFRTSQFNGECFRYGRGIMLMRWRTYSTEFRAIEVPLLSLDEQKQIVEFLDKKMNKVDMLIGNVQKQIEKLKAYKQSLITEVVTKGLDSDVPMKDSGVEWIGEMPQHWKMVPMKILGTVRNGLTYSPEDLCDEEEGVLVLRSSNIQNGVLSFDDNVYVNKKVLEDLLVSENDILICSRNGSRKLIGKNAVIPKGINASFGAFMMIFRTIQNAKYCKYILDSSIFQYYLGTYLTATINQLTAQNFKSMQAPFTFDKDEQARIVAFLEPKCIQIERLIAIKQAKIEKLEEYKRSLIYEYVTGKKEVF